MLSHGFNQHGKQISKPRKDALLHRAVMETLEGRQMLSGTPGTETHGVDLRSMTRDSHVVSMSKLTPEQKAAAAALRAELLAAKKLARVEAAAARKALAVQRMIATFSHKISAQVLSHARRWTDPKFQAQVTTAQQVFAGRIARLGGSYTPVPFASLLPGAQTAPVLAPTLSQTFISATEIDLSWTAIASAISYKLENSLDGGTTWSTLVTTAGTAYANVGLSPDTAYKYRVSAVTAQATSVPSTVFSATTFLGAPTNLAAIATSATNINLTWTLVTDATSYKIERSTNGTTWSAFTPLSPLGASSANTADTTVIAGTTYYYHIAAIIGSNSSVFSGPVAVSTLPATPVLTTVVVSTSEIDLSWTAVGTAIVYKLEDSIDNGTTWSTLQTDPATTFNHLSLTADTTYKYRVTATNNSGSVTSLVVTAATLLNAPTGFIANAASATEIDLAWIAVTDAATYKIERSADGAVWSTISAALAASNKTYADTGLTAGTTYHYRISATDAAGTSVPASPIVATTFPAVPTLTAVVVSATEIDLSWSASTSATSYKLESSTDGGATWTTAVTQGTLTYADHAVVADTVYKFRVTAINPTGSSAPSALVAATTPLAAPSGFAATVVSPTEIDLGWIPIADAATYKIETSANGTTWSTLVGAQAGNTDTYNNTGLTAGTVYYYRISAVNTAGTSAAAAIGPFTTLPVAPTLTAHVLSSAEIDLSWTSSASATSYKLESSTDGGVTWTTTISQQGTSYQHTALTSDKTYTYRVTAINTTGNSVLSNTVSGTTLLATPTGLAATVISATEIDLAWSPEFDATGYKLEVSTNAGATWTTITPITAFTGTSSSYANTGLTAGTAYSYRLSSTDTAGISTASVAVNAATLPAAPVATATTFSAGEIDLAWPAITGAGNYKIEKSADGGTTWTVAVASQAALTYKDTGLTADSLYKYRVTAINGSQLSAPSSVVSATTSLIAPANFTTHVASATEVDLAWTSVKDVTTYKIERSLDGSSWTTVSATLAGSNVTFADTGLTAGVSYTYRISSTNANGTSAAATAAAVVTLPAAPTLTAAVVSATSVLLTWTTVTSATNYKLESSSDGGNTWTMAVTQLTPLTYTQSGLTPNLTYKYRVSATNVTGYGATSAIQTANTTLNAPTGLTATPISATEIDLKWAVVASATTYRIDRSTDNTNWITLIPSPVLTGSSIAYNDLAVSPGTTNYYRITTVAGVNSSAASTAISALSFPPVPVLTAVATSTTQINLSWSTALSATTYKLEKSTDGGTTWSTLATQAGTTKSDTGLTPAANYKYRVSATNASGTSAASTVIAVAATPLTASGFAAAAASTTSVTLTWNAISNTSTYKLARSLDQVTWTPVVPGSPLTGSSVTYTDSGLVAGTNYYYSLVAVDVSGNQAPTLLTQVVTLPTAPTVTSAVISPTQINLIWTSPASATSFEIDQSTDGGSTWTTLATQATTTYSVTGLTADTSYKFRVSAINVSGPSAATVVTAATQLPAPTGLLALVPSSTEVDLQWTGVNDATSYKVERSLNGTTWTTPTQTLTSTSIAFSDTGLSAGVTYYYRISATGPNGTSVTTSPITAITLPAAPVSLTPTVISTTEIDLAWPTAVGATGYEIEKSSDGGTTWTVAVANQAGNTYQSTGLTADHTYKYRVTTINTTGTSAPSTVATATTLEPAVAGLTATVTSATQIDLAWTAIGDALTYKIERSPNNTVWSTLTSSLAGTSSTYTDSGVTAGSTYYYRISVANAGGISATAVSTATLTVPAAPVLTVTVTSPTAVALSWTTPTGAANFKIEQSIDGGNTWSTAVASQAPATYAATGLNPGVAYTFRVSALNTTGASVPSANQTVTTLFAAPTGLTLTAASATEIDLTWAVVAGSTGYKIERSLNGTTWTNITGASSLTGSSTTFADTGLTAGTLYSYRISTISASGTSAASTTATATTFPVAPTLAAIAASATAISLSWNAPLSAQNYKIERSVDGGTTWTVLVASQSAVTYQNTTLSPDTLYKYRVSAINGSAVSVPSAVVTVTTPLAAVSGFTGTIISPTEIDLAWNALTDAVTFKIERSLNNSTWTVITGTLAASNLTYADHTVAAGTTYYYRISAIDAAGTSATASTAALLALPAAPTLSAVATLTTAITLSWTASVSATGYKIEKSTDGGTTFTQLVATQTPTTYSVTGLTADTSYVFRVSAINGTGNTPSTVTARTLLIAPTSFTTTVHSATEIDLAWTAVTDAVTYKIERSLNNSTWTLLTATLAASNTTYADQAVVAGTTYYYRISATDAAGTSVVTTSTANLTLPAAPTLTATVASATAVNLAWTAALSAASYKIESSSDGGFNWSVVAASATGTSYAVTGLNVDTGYKYRVSATNGTGSSATSNVTSVTTFANSPTNVIGTAVSGVEIDLTWTAVIDATGYKVEHSTNGITWTTAAANNGSAAYNDTGLTAGTAYYYRISAISASGTSSPSSTITLPTLSAAPTVTAVAASTTQINLSWLAQAGATGYKVESSSDGGTNWTIAATPSGITYSSTGLTADTVYKFRVSSTNASGTSVPSAVVSASTLLASPAGTAVSVISTTEVDLSWTAETDAITYKVEHSTDNATWTVLVASTASTSYHDTSVVAGTLYYYRVSSIDAAGTSTPAASISALTKPAQPVLTATPVSPTQINLSWAAIKSATSYSLEFSSDAGANWASAATPAGTSFSDTGLTADTAYEFRVSAVNATATGAPSTVVNASTLIVAPVGLASSAITASEIDLAWTAETDATNYKLERSINGTTWVTLSSSIGTNAYNNTGLTSNTAYSYRLSSNSIGGTSATSSVVVVTTLPSTPTLTAHPISPTEIDFTWPASTGATGYKLEMSTDSGTNWTTAATPVPANYNDTALAADTAYEFRVSAAVGGTYSATSPVVNTSTLLTAPAGLALTAQSTTEIDLAWTTETDATTYKVERSLNNSTWTTVAAADNTNAYSDTGLTPGATYYYRVSSNSVGGTSAPGAVQHAAALPVAPTLAAHAATPTEIDLSWNASNGATGYFLEISSDAGANWTTAASPVTTTYADTILTADQAYQFRVSATIGGESSATSSVASTSTLLVAPVGLALTAHSTTEIDLAWTTETDAVTYKVERSLNNTTWTTAAAAANTNAYSDTGLTPGQTYYYRVSSNSVGGTSAPGTVQHAAALPVAPTLAAHAATPTEIDLSWNASNGATGYFLEISSDAGANWTTAASPVTTTYADTILTADQAYQFRVSATIGGESSATSSVASTSTLLVAPVGLALTAHSTTEIDLAWTAETDAVTYKVERSLNNTTWTTAAAAANTNAYSDTGLTPGQTYYYRVSSNSVGGTSATGTVQHAAALPAAPALTAKVISPTQVNLSWNAPFGATAYLLESSSDAGSNWTTLSTPSTTSFNATTLTADTAYEFRVSATIGGESSATSTVVNASTLVVAPVGLALSPQSTTAINLTWTTETDALTYKVERSPNGTTLWTTLAAADNTNSYSDTGLTAGTTYYYRISSNSTGGTSATGTVVSGITNPVAPTLTATTASATSVSLAWTASVGATSYLVENSTDAGANWTTTVTQAGTTYSATGLVADTAYQFRVSAVVGSQHSATSTVANATTLLTAPAVPTFTVASSTEIDLAWTAVTDAVTYKVEHSLDGSTWTTASAAVGTNAYSDTALTPGTIYYYRVSATDAAGTSLASTVAHTVTKPAAPVLAAAVASSTAINLSWTTVKSATGYTLQQSTDAGTNWTTLATNQVGTTFAATGLTAASSYEFQVLAINGSGNSAYSTPVTQSTLLVAPVGLGLTVVSNSEIDLAWTTSAGATGYKVEHSTDGVKYTTVAANNATTSYHDTGLTTGTLYYYRVSAISAPGTSLPGTPMSAATLLAAPVGLVATTVSTTQINLSWTADTAAGLTGFILESSTDGGTTYTALETVAAGSTSASDVKLTTGTTYYYKLIAVNAGGSSVPSAAAHATTN